MHNRFNEIKKSLYRIRNAECKIAHCDDTKHCSFEIIDDRGEWGKFSTNYIVEYVPPDEKPPKGIVATMTFYDVRDRKHAGQVYHLHCEHDDYAINDGELGLFISDFWCYNEKQVMDKVRWFRQRVRR